jgi:hypothetical protein
MLSLPDSYDFCLIFWKLNTNKILLWHNACMPFWCSEDIKKIGLEWHIWRLWHSIDSIFTQSHEACWSTIMQTLSSSHQFNLFLPWYSNLYPELSVLTLDWTHDAHALRGHWHREVLNNIPEWFSGVLLISRQNQRLDWLIGVEFQL